MGSAWFPGSMCCSGGPCRTGLVCKAPCLPLVSSSPRKPQSCGHAQWDQLFSIQDFHWHRRSSAPCPVNCPSTYNVVRTQGVHISKGSGQIPDYHSPSNCFGPEQCLQII